MVIFGKVYVSSSICLLLYGSLMIENGKNPNWPPATLKKKHFIAKDPIIKCNMLFLTNSVVSHF